VIKAAKVIDHTQNEHLADKFARNFGTGVASTNHGPQTHA
jgi:hypothetical protein